MIKILVCGLLAAIIAPWSGSAQAQGKWEGWDYTFDREISPWEEMQAQLPAYPLDQNLIPVDVGSATPHRYFVDALSISTAKDGVTRYTLVIKTAGGATNVSFEGMRCESREQKYYAIGRPNRTWGRARNPQWRYIEARDVITHHFTLYREYLCRGKITVEPAEEVVRLLRAGPKRSPILD